MSVAYLPSICPWRHGLSTAGVFRFVKMEITVATTLPNHNNEEQFY